MIPLIKSWDMPISADREGEPAGERLGERILGNFEQAAFLKRTISMEETIRTVIMTKVRIYHGEL
jgi:hypothetical protein